MCRQTYTWHGTYRTQVGSKAVTIANIQDVCIIIQLFVWWRTDNTTYFSWAMHLRALYSLMKAQPFKTLSSEIWPADVKIPFNWFNRTQRNSFTDELTSFLCQKIQKNQTLNSYWTIIQTFRAYLATGKQWYLSCDPKLSSYFYTIFTFSF
jgi:hypothetical protein